MPNTNTGTHHHHYHFTTPSYKSAILSKSATYDDVNLCNECVRECHHPTKKVKVDFNCIRDCYRSNRGCLNQRYGQGTWAVM